MEGKAATSTFPISQLLEPSGRCDGDILAATFGLLLIRPACKRQCVNMEGASNIHRRKSSKDLEDEELVIPVPREPRSRPPSIILAPPPPGNRPESGHSRSTSVAGISASSPGLAPVPTSAGPYRTTFNGTPNGRPVNGVNGFHAPASASAYKTTFGHSHSRTRSVSGPFAPPQPSPLASSFPLGPNMPVSSSNPSISSTPFPAQLSASRSLPLDEANSVNLNDPPSTSPKSNRRHTRLHSRNLSIFFPRPGSLPTSSIAEDGSQELELQTDIEAPVSTIPSAGSSVQFPRSQSMSNGHAPPTPLGAGFTFGGRPSAHSTPAPAPAMGPINDSNPASSSTAKSRRGHHHKHSMSHSFFSFLEPGATGIRPNGVPSAAPAEELHTQPTPIPVSPWTPTPALPTTPSLQSLSDESEAEGVPLSASIGTIGQFLVGAWLWVCGQRIGSLSCTGIGYWVVFDSFGVGIGKVLPGWLNPNDELSNAREREREALRRPYGTKRVLTVFMFAQAVYLLFSAVYVCKETIEHVLLAAGEGHHHHPGEDDDWIGIEFPPLMTLFTFCSIIATARLYSNHAKLIDVTGNRIPTPLAFLRSLAQSSRAHSTYTNTPNSSNTPLANMLSNPYITSPLVFCLAMFSIAVFLPPTQHRPADLVLASVIALVTFKVSYRACTVLGTVLLQTAPVRGLSSGRMESFLRVMREVERHPNVLHLPAPHIWQLTPSSVHSLKDEAGETLIVTVQLHVREDLGDDEILALTKWTWERVWRALSSTSNSVGGGSVNANAKGVVGGEKGKGGAGGVEVTVGVTYRSWPPGEMASRLTTMAYRNQEIADHLPSSIMQANANNDVWLQILKYLRISLSNDSSQDIRIKRHTHLSIALACKDLKDIALDTLWESMTTLQPVSLVFKPAPLSYVEEQHQEHWDISCSMEDLDSSLAEAQVYLSRIKILHFSTFPRAKELTLWLPLLSLGNFSCLCPNLRELYLDFGECGPNAIYYFRTLLSPSIKVINFTSILGANIDAIAGTLLGVLQRVNTHLEVVKYGRTVSSKTLIQLIKFASLSSLTVTPWLRHSLSWDAATVHSFPPSASLETLDIGLYVMSVESLPALGLWLTRLASLKTLQVFGSWELINSCLFSGPVTLPSLQSLSLVFFFNKVPRTSDLRIDPAIFRQLSSISPELRALRIHNKNAGRDAWTRTLTIDDVLEYGATSLQELSLDSVNADFDAASIALLTTKWTRLTSLCIAPSVDRRVGYTFDTESTLLHVSENGRYLRHLSIPLRNLVFPSIAFPLTRLRFSCPLQTLELCIVEPELPGDLGDRLRLVQTLLRLFPNLTAIKYTGTTASGGACESLPIVDLQRILSFARGVIVDATSDMRFPL
ncbi:hypothetical protein NP233_g9338 [Leucocoprinus birnbaumii]|uniref:Cation efflux protein transmembrane domain-containing protein n=1 Tax=Leucocoprinus birnbaumii TaxID=56174 RepID=A0AAD5YSZ4_9AGAR|nr:hypothetical protein NP233_g9338 [Leucocoprinus birnbaumii]